MPRVWEDQWFSEGMNPTELQEWVAADPTRVNNRDREGNTPLCMAANGFESLPLVLLLLDEMGADVNATRSGGWTALHGDRYCLAGRGAVLENDSCSPLFEQACMGTVEFLRRGRKFLFRCESSYTEAESSCSDARVLVQKPPGNDPIYLSCRPWVKARQPRSSPCSSSSSSPPTPWPPSWST
jgi:hypothetical protein